MFGAADDVAMSPAGIEEVLSRHTLFVPRDVALPEDHDLGLPRPHRTVCELRRCLARAAAGNV
jgi:hypothetical protein